MKYEIHDFYCLKCGKSTPLPRSRGKEREKNHRKKLFCYNCREEINHIECRNYAERMNFLEKFERGEFVNEAEESENFVSSLRCSW